MNERTDRRHFWIEFGMVVILLVLFAPMFYSQIFLKENNDFGLHILYASQMLDEPEKVPAFNIAHAGWQMQVVGVRGITNSSWKTSAFLVTLASAVLAGWVLFRVFRRGTRRMKVPDLWAVGLTLGTLLATPVSILGFRDGLFYFGYLGMNTYHNATILLLKPLAIVQFFLALRVFDGSRSTWLQVIATFCLSAYAAFAKPNFTICLLPMMGLLFLVFWWKKKSLDWKLFIVGFGIPSSAVVLWQMLLSYSPAEEGGAIFAPFGVMGVYSNHLLIKFFLSILFPMVVTLFNFKEARRSNKMTLAWLSFLLGAFYTYFLAESGDRFQDGNFGWSGEIANFILFVVSTYFLLERLSLTAGKGKGSLKKIWLPQKGQSMIVWAAWGSHVTAGIIYYLVCLLTNRYQ